MGIETRLISSCTLLLGICTAKEEHCLSLFTGVLVLSSVATKNPAAETQRHGVVWFIALLASCLLCKAATELPCTFVLFSSFLTGLAVAAPQSPVTFMVRSTVIPGL